MRLHTVVFCLLSAGTALSAQASYVTIQYDGVVSKVVDAAEAPGIAVGDVVTYSATFDPGKAVDVGSTIVAFDADTGLAVHLPHLKTISIADDPNASDKVTIGSYVFTQANDPTFGQDFGLGAGAFPFVVYDGSTLLGLDMTGDMNGLSFSSDPIARLLNYSHHTGLGGLDSSPNLSFTVDTELDGAIAASYAAATAVPEPSTWITLALGLGVFGFATRMPAAARHTLRNVARLGRRATGERSPMA